MPEPTLEENIKNLSEEDFIDLKMALLSIKEDILKSPGGLKDPEKPGYNLRKVDQAFIGFSSLPDIAKNFIENSLYPNLEKADEDDADFWREKPGYTVSKALDDMRTGPGVGESDPVPVAVSAPAPPTPEEEPMAPVGVRTRPRTPSAPASPGSGIKIDLGKKPRRRAPRKVTKLEYEAILGLINETDLKSTQEGAIKSDEINAFLEDKYNRFIRDEEPDSLRQKLFEKLSKSYIEAVSKFNGSLLEIIAKKRELIELNDQIRSIYEEDNSYSKETGYGEPSELDFSEGYYTSESYEEGEPEEYGESYEEVSEVAEDEQRLTELGNKVQHIEGSVLPELKEGKRKAEAEMNDSRERLENFGSSLERERNKAASGRRSSKKYKSEIVVLDFETKISSFDLDRKIKEAKNKILSYIEEFNRSTDQNVLDTETQQIISLKASGDLLRKGNEAFHSIHIIYRSIDDAEDRSKFYKEFITFVKKESEDNLKFCYGLVYIMKMSLVGLSITGKGMEESSRDRYKEALEKEIQADAPNWFGKFILNTTSEESSSAVGYFRSSIKPSYIIQRARSKVFDEIGVGGGEVDVYENCPICYKFVKKVGASEYDDFYKLNIPNYYPYTEDGEVINFQKIKSSEINGAHLLDRNYVEQILNKSNKNVDLSLDTRRFVQSLGGTGKSWEEIINLMESSNSQENCEGLIRMSGVLRSAGAKWGGYSSSSVSNKFNCPSGKDNFCGLEVRNPPKEGDKYYNLQPLQREALSPEIEWGNTSLRYNIMRSISYQGDPWAPSWKSDNLQDSAQRLSSGGRRFSSRSFGCPCHIEDLDEDNFYKYKELAIRLDYSDQYVGPTRPDGIESDVRMPSFAVCGANTSISSLDRDSSSPTYILTYLKEVSRQNPAEIKSFIELLSEHGFNMLELIEILNDIDSDKEIEKKSTINSKFLYRKKIRLDKLNDFLTKQAAMTGDIVSNLLSTNVIRGLILVCPFGHKFSIGQSLMFGKQHGSRSINSRRDYIRSREESFNSEELSKFIEKFMFELRGDEVQYLYYEDWINSQSRSLTPVKLSGMAASKTRYLKIKFDEKDYGFKKEINLNGNVWDFDKFKNLATKQITGDYITGQGVSLEAEEGGENQKLQQQMIEAYGDSQNNADDLSADSNYGSVNNVRDIPIRPSVDRFGVTIASMIDAKMSFLDEMGIPKVRIPNTDEGVWFERVIQKANILSRYIKATLTVVNTWNNNLVINDIKEYLVGSAAIKKHFSSEQPRILEISKYISNSLPELSGVPLEDISNSIEKKMITFNILRPREVFEREDGSSLQIWEVILKEAISSLLVEDEELQSSIDAVIKEISAKTLVRGRDNLFYEIGGSRSVNISDILETKRKRGSGSVNHNQLLILVTLSRFLGMTIDKFKDIYQDPNKKGYLGFNLLGEIAEYELYDIMNIKTDSIAKIKTEWSNSTEIKMFKNRVAMDPYFDIENLLQNFDLAYGFLRAYFDNADKISVNPASISETSKYIAEIAKREGIIGDVSQIRIMSEQNGTLSSIPFTDSDYSTENIDAGGEIQSVFSPRCWIPKVFHSIPTAASVGSHKYLEDLTVETSDDQSGTYLSNPKYNYDSRYLQLGPMQFISGDSPNTPFAWPYNPFDFTERWIEKRMEYELGIAAIPDAPLVPPSRTSKSWNNVGITIPIPSTRTGGNYSDLNRAPISSCVMVVKLPITDQAGRTVSADIDISFLMQRGSSAGKGEYSSDDYRMPINLLNEIETLKEDKNMSEEDKRDRISKLRREYMSIALSVSRGGKKDGLSRFGLKFSQGLSAGEFSQEQISSSDPKKNPLLSGPTYKGKTGFETSLYLSLSDPICACRLINNFEICSDGDFSSLIISPLELQTDPEINNKIKGAILDFVVGVYGLEETAKSFVGKNETYIRNDLGVDADSFDGRKLLELTSEGKIVGGEEVTPVSCDFSGRYYDISMEYSSVSYLSIRERDGGSKSGTLVDLNKDSKAAKMLGITSGDEVRATARACAAFRDYIERTLRVEPKSNKADDNINYDNKYIQKIKQRTEHLDSIMNSAIDDIINPNKLFNI